jgi:hypothetical protein
MEAARQHPESVQHLSILAAGLHGGFADRAREKGSISLKSMDELDEKMTSAGARG